MTEREPQGSRPNETESQDVQYNKTDQQNIVMREYSYGPGLVREYLDTDHLSYGFIGRAGVIPASIRVAEVEYIAPTGTVFKLTSLLPEGYTFRRVGGTGSPTTRSDVIDYYENLDVPILNRDNKLKNYTGKFFEHPGSFFGLLHELGHARRSARLPKQERINQEISTFFLNHGRVTESSILDRLQDERDASAFALSTVHSLRKSGIDLEPEIVTREQLQWLAYGPIAGYEFDSISKLNTPEAKKWAERRRAQTKDAMVQADMSILIREAIRPKKGLQLQVQAQTQPQAKWWKRLLDRLRFLQQNSRYI